MIVTGIILLVIGVLAKIGIVWTTGFVVLILGLIALLLGMTGHGIGGGDTPSEARSWFGPSRYWSPRPAGRHRPPRQRWRRCRRWRC
jgi:hypothetical protein